MYISKLYEDLKDVDKLREFIVACMGEYWVKGRDLHDTKLTIRDDTLIMFLYDDLGHTLPCLNFMVTDYKGYERIHERDITNNYRVFMKRYPGYREKCIEFINKEAEERKRIQIENLGL